MQFGPYFIRHPLLGVLVIAMITLAGVLGVVLLFVVFVWESTTDERYAITVSNQTGEEVRMTYSLAWDVASDGELTPADDYESADRRLDVDTCLIVPLERGESGERPGRLEIERVQVNGERVLFECSYPLLLQPGESRIYRVAWDNADGTRGRESALHRISGLHAAGFRVIDLAWDELVATGVSVVFTEETPYR